MTENLEVNKAELFEEVVETGRAEGVTDQEAYNELVEAVIEDHRRVGELHDDSSYDVLIETLQARWPDYRESLGLDSGDVQL